MAWRSSGKTNAELIANLQANGIFNSQRVSKAMSRVDRANYVLNHTEAYEDSPQSIGYEATISAPHMHAHAVENLLPFLSPGSKVLDVGSGSGYLTAVLHHLVTDEGEGKLGKVVAIDHIPQLVARSRDNLRNDGLGKAIENAQIELVCGDGRQGYPRAGPFDAIHVGAAAPVMPPALIDQLARPGRMFIPVGTHSQYVWQVDKDKDGNVDQTKLMGVSYVPLADRPN